MSYTGRPPVYVSSPSGHRMRLPSHGSIGIGLCAETQTKLVYRPYTRVDRRAWSFVFDRAVGQGARLSQRSLSPCTDMALPEVEGSK